MSTSTARPPTPPTFGRVIGAAVTADIDADGRSDRAVLRRGGGQQGVLRDALVVSLGRGGQLHRMFLDFGSAQFPTDRLLGVADVNGDGRDELIVFTGGNTAFGAAVVTLVNGRLLLAQARGDYIPAFGGHGTTCGACTQDATCQDVRGEPRLVETFSTYLSRRGRDLTGVEQARTHDNSPLASHRRRWEAAIYDLRGAHLVHLKTLRGVEPPGAGLPTRFRFRGELQCGSARWPAGSA